MTTGQRIKQLRIAKGLSQDELGALVGVKKAAINKYESGVIVNLKRSTIAKLADALETSPTYIMGWESRPETLPDNIFPMPQTRKVPRLGAIACGKPILAEGNIEMYDDIPEYISCDFTLVCKGNSMINARIFDGDIVCIRQQPEVENGEIAAVMIDGEYDGEATLKRVKSYDDHIILEPENPEHRPFVFWGEEMGRVHILGKATHFVSVVR